MKKYRVFVDGTQHLVEIDESGPGEYSVRLRGKEAKIRIEEVLDIKRSEKEHTGIIKENIKTEQKSEINTDTVEAGVPLRAPMPGNVVKVIAKEGSAVKMGEPVIILEAMKMNNEISAPVSGIVKEIRVKEGDNIDSEDIIAVIEEVK